MDSDGIANHIKYQYEGTQMNKHKGLFGITGGLILFVIGLFIGWLDISGRLPWQSDNLYKDPQGRFTMKIDPSWEQVKTDGSYTQFKVPNPPMQLYALVIPAGTIKETFSLALTIVGFDPDLLTGGDQASFGDWLAYAKVDSLGFNYGLAGQISGENAYVLIVRGDKPGIGTQNAAVMRALMSIKIANPASSPQPR